MSALFHLYLCGRNAAEWLIYMDRHEMESIRRTAAEKIKDICAKYGLYGNVIYYEPSPVPDSNRNRLYIVAGTDPAVGKDPLPRTYHPEEILRRQNRSKSLFYPNAWVFDLSYNPDDISEIDVGDVITFHLLTEDGSRVLVTHRIIAIDDGYIYTKGDNNRVSDAVPITMDNVEAKVVKVFNQTAWLVSKWQTTSGKVMLITGVLAIVFAYISLKMWLRVRADQKDVSIDADIVEPLLSEPNADVPSQPVHHVTPELETDPKSSEGVDDKI